MNETMHRLLFEASSVAANFSSAPHRLAAAKEAAAMDVQDLATTDQARAYLAVAVKNCVIALALMTTDDARASTADALRSLVAAARARPRTAQVLSSHSEYRRYWIDR
jgi:hypothetical protein